MPPGQDEPKRWRGVPDQLVHSGEDAGSGKVADVIDDQCHRLSEPLGELGEPQRECVVAGIGQVARDLGGHSRCLRERQPDVCPQLARPAVAIVEAKPADAAGLGRCRPRSARHRLARTRWPADQGHPILRCGSADQASDPRTLKQGNAGARRPYLVAGRQPKLTPLRRAQPNAGLRGMWIPLAVLCA